MFESNNNKKTLTLEAEVQWCETPWVQTRGCGFGKKLLLVFSKLLLFIFVQSVVEVTY